MKKNTKTAICIDDLQFEAQTNPAINIGLAVTCRLNFQITRCIVPPYCYLPNSEQETKAMTAKDFDDYIYGYFRKEVTEILRALIDSEKIELDDEIAKRLRDLLLNNETL